MPILPKSTPSTPPTRPAAAAAIAEWAAAILLCANLAWTALCLGGVRAETMAWSGLLTCATFAIVTLRRMTSPVTNHPAANHWVHRCLLPFTACLLINVLFLSPVRWLGIFDLFLWLQTYLVFSIVLDGLQNKAPRRLVLGTISVLAVLALILSAYQLNGHQNWLMLGRAQASQYIGRASGFFGNPNSLAALYILVIPPVLALTWRRGASGVQRLACGYIALALMLGLVMTISRGGLLALAIALICWPCFTNVWTWPGRLLTCGAVLVTLALAALALWTTMPSVRARLQTLAHDHGERSRIILWQASLKMTADAPVLGAGAGSFNTIFEKHRPEGFLNNPQWAHNEYLNLLSDQGIAGFALLFGGIGAIAWRNRRKTPRPPRPALPHDTPPRPTPSRDTLPHYAPSRPPRPAPPRDTLPRHAPTDAMLADASFTRALGIGLLAFALACLVDFHMHIPALGMIVAVYAAEILKRRQPPAPPASITPLSSPTPLALLAPAASPTPLALAPPAPTAPAALLASAETALQKTPAQTPGITATSGVLATPNLPNLIATLATLAALLLLACLMTNTYRAEAARVSGREQIDSLAIQIAAQPTAQPADPLADPLALRAQQTEAYQSALARAGALIAEATRRDPGNAQAWADCAYALALRARVEKQNAAPLGRDAETAARKALALAPGVPEFWIRLGVALDLRQRTAEAGDAFTRALRLAPASPLAWYHQAYHLSLTPATRDLALGAAATCLRLDPGHRDANILRVRLESNP
ncbi:MAG: O-antigen ligase family protein [Opitutaceae bacterium]|jgi:O-antigen ligase/tetratricopeptide (TPR) repeat protein|nr:O-antigen ligase family protein [Opitutaceae bacterium]